jgi:hypothetical protein
MLLQTMLTEDGLRDRGTLQEAGDECMQLFSDRNGMLV